MNTNWLVQRNKISGYSALSMFYTHFDIRSLLLQQHKFDARTETLLLQRSSKYHVWPSSQFQICAGKLVKQRNTIVLNPTNSAWVHGFVPPKYGATEWFLKLMKIYLYPSPVPCQCPSRAASTQDTGPHRMYTGGTRVTVIRTCGGKEAVFTTPLDFPRRFQGSSETKL